MFNRKIPHLYSPTSQSARTLAVMQNRKMENEKISVENGKWYIAEIIEKCEPVNRNEAQELRRVKTWGNFHIIKAETPKKAYDKAVKIGK